MSHKMLSERCYSRARPLVAVLLLCLVGFTSQTHEDGLWQSSMVYYDDDGTLVYHRDDEGNMIPDFSHAGYGGGGIPLPVVPVVETIEPVAGDNTAHIQAAIDRAGNLPLGPHGFRGAILLRAGVYHVNGTIRLNHSGVVLRGEGDGENTSENTLLLVDRRTTAPVLVAGGGTATNWSDEVPNTRSRIIEDALVGERHIVVDNPALYNAGDNIIIVHPSTREWLSEIDNGGTATDPGWHELEIDFPPILFNRRIRHIEGSRIELDVPLFNHIHAHLSHPYIYKHDREGIKTQIGIESLRITITTLSDTDENHPFNAVQLIQIEDSWVRDVTALHFVLSGFITQTASRITIINCKALEPHSSITGARRYNFNLAGASSQILFQDCLATYGRHHFISNGTTSVSGCVFLNCEGRRAYSSSEGHRWWSMGLLFDNVREVDVQPTAARTLAFINRGDWGTAHGWSTVHSVMWNCDAGDGAVLVQKPPTGQNYAIGCNGRVVTGRPPHVPFDQPEGHIEGTGRSGLMPGSLYLAQLRERLSGCVD